MAMKVAQIIKSAQSNDINSFITDTSKTLLYVHDYNFDNSDYSFYNSCISINGGFIANTSYYIKTQILRKDVEQHIIIEFYDGEGNTQRIKKITVPAEVKDKRTYNLEFIASPGINYKFIAFRLIRTADDYLYSEINAEMIKAGLVGGIGDTQYKIPGRIVKFNNALNSGIDTVDGVMYIGTLKNLLPTDMYIIKKVGIQGPAGTVMSINGEEIKIGYRGVYELLNEIPITFLGIYPNDLNHPIIIDYQYNEK